MARVLVCAASAVLLLATLASGARAQAVSADDLLEPEEAFRFSVRAIEPSAVEVEYAIADGYYLYRQRFAFAVEPATATLGVPQFPTGAMHEDKFFGRSETYRGRVRITLPVESADPQIKLVATSQGCADFGVCYQPQEHSAVIRLPTTAASAAGAPATIMAASAQAPADLGPANDETRFSSIVGSGGVWATIVAFFGAGLLLAFTPCVLPMMPILSGIIVGAGQGVTRRRALMLSLAYVLGMAVTYTALGIAAAASGTLLSATLQNPWVLGAFSLVIEIGRAHV